MNMPRIGTLEAVEMREHGYKWCARCQTAYPFALFGKNAVAVDGLAAICKACARVALSSFRREGRDSRSKEKQAKGEADKQGRECVVCHTVKSLSEFYKNKGSLGGRLTRCKPCHRAVMAAPAARAKQNALRLANMVRVDALKLAAGCVDCGYRGAACALDYDHLGDDKSAGVATLLNRAWEVIAAEIAKCEVVCANCHRIRTKDRLNTRKDTDGMGA